MTQPRDRVRPRPPSTISSARWPSVLGAVLVGVLMAACGPGPTEVPPTGLSSPTTTPTSPASSPGLSLTPPAGSPEATPATAGPGTAACTAIDLKVSHGLVEGTAGSRNTEVVLVTAIECALPAWPAFGLRDGAGGALIAGTPGGDGQIAVRPGGSYTSEVQVSNWCGPDPTYPATLELRLGSEAVGVTGGPFPEEGDMPPCTGGATPSLSGTAWTPSS